MQQPVQAESAVAWQSVAAHGWSHRRTDADRWHSIMMAISALSTESKQQIIGRDLIHSLFNVARLDARVQPGVAYVAREDGTRLQNYLFGRGDQGEHKGDEDDDDDSQPPPDGYNSDDSTDEAIRELESAIHAPNPPPFVDDESHARRPPPHRPPHRFGVKTREPSQRGARKTGRAEAVLRARLAVAQARLTDSLARRARPARRRRDDSEDNGGSGDKRPRATTALTDEERAFLKDISAVLIIIGQNVDAHRPTLELMLSDLNAILHAGQLSDEAREELTAATRHIEGLLRSSSPSPFGSDSSDSSVVVDEARGSESHPPTRYHVGQSVDEDSIAKQRGDGNCFFRCIAFVVYGDAERHPAVRSAVCDWMAAHQDELARWFGDGLANHIEKMRRERTWATELELFSTGRLFLMNLEVFDVRHDRQTRTYTLTSFVRRTPYIDNPSYNTWLIHPNANHYDVLCYEAFGRRQSKRRGAQDAQDEDQPTQTQGRRNRRDDTHFTVQGTGDPDDLEHILAQRRAGGGERVPMFTVPAKSAEDEDVPDAVSVQYEPLADVRPIRIRRRDDEDEDEADEADEATRAKRQRVAEGASGSGDRSRAKRARDVELRRLGGPKRRRRYAADDDDEVAEASPQDAEGTFGVVEGPSASRKRQRDVEIARQGGPARRRRLNTSVAEDQPPLAPRRRRAARAPVGTVRRQSARIAERDAARARAKPRRSTRTRTQTTRKEPKTYGVGGAIRSRA